MRKPNPQCDTLILYTDFFLCTVVNIFLSRENAIDTTVYVIPVRAFDHICMEKARYKFLIIIIIIIIIIIHTCFVGLGHSHQGK